MESNIQNFKKKIEEIKEWLKKEFSSIRTGRATSAILDSITVDSYGSRMHINQIANITNEDARTLRITPWDRSQLKSIENAISSSNLGISVSVDDKGIRVIFPDLTSETRASLLKVAKTKLEEARISVRTERDKVWSDTQEKEKNKQIGEDEKYTIKDKLQKIIDETNKELDLIYEKKKNEIEN
ncbi:MAG: Ribosome recycling factor [Parcubacteria group bacterium Athens0714_16]|nr:MAG: Ribosome recycling factor [Parcubacteria group bacterium Athens0714_16]